LPVGLSCFLSPQLPFILLVEMRCLQLSLHPIGGNALPPAFPSSYWWKALHLAFPSFYKWKFYAAGQLHIGPWNPLLQFYFNLAIKMSYTVYEEIKEDGQVFKNQLFDPIQNSFYKLNKNLICLFKKSTIQNFWNRSCHT
jgi:hypothetical protein